MADSVSRMLAQIDSNASAPPIEKWDPPLSGDIDIHIDQQGRWFHESSPIEREQLVNLFASIMRYEDECGYVLVTPVEKWRIKVDDAPLLAIAASIRQDDNGDAAIWLATNVGGEYCVTKDQPLVNEGDLEKPRPYILLPRGLKARLTQSVYYQLAENIEQDDAGFYLQSCGERFNLG